MWIYSKKQSAWVNLDNAQRISKDGKGGYIITCNDGKSLPIDSETYDGMLRYIDVNWWEKHPDGKKDSFNTNDALKAIMKELGVKITKKKDEED